MAGLPWEGCGQGEVWLLVTMREGCGHEGAWLGVDCMTSWSLFQNCTRRRMGRRTSLSLTSLGKTP